MVQVNVETTGSIRIKQTPSPMLYLNVHKTYPKQNKSPGNPFQSVQATDIVQKNSPLDKGKGCSMFRVIHFLSI